MRPAVMAMSVVGGARGDTARSPFDGIAADVVVVGGSFAGTSAALQLARARRRVVVVDAGAPRNRFATAAHGFLGQDGFAPADIIATARSQLLAYPTARWVDGTVTAATPRDGGFDLVLADGARLSACRIVLAAGIVDELPALPGVAERWGRTVLHCPYCHGYEVADRRLGVLAIAPQSLHQALLLPDWGPVTLFTNGVFEPDAEQRAELDARGVTVEPRRVVQLLGDAPALSGVQLDDGRVIPVEALFTGTRTRFADGLAEALGCAIDEGPFGPLVRTDPMTRATTVAGVFAAGDAIRFPHNATWASADGVAAGVFSHASLALPAGVPPLSGPGDGPR